MAKNDNNKEALTVEEGAVKAVKRKRNRPDLANFGAENVEPGDNTRYLRFARLPFSLPPIDISDEKQVEQRINDYFLACEQNDMKPNMVGMANWLGVDRTTLTSWKRGEYRTVTHSPLINKAIGMLEELWVDYMQNGKVNPASGIFLGKNLFGYRDQQDVIITPPSPIGEAAEQKELAANYVVETE